MLKRGVNALFVCTECSARFGFKVDIHREVLEEGEPGKKA
jgi:hypothetical protein